MKYLKDSELFNFKGAQAMGKQCYSGRSSGARRGQFSDSGYFNIILMSLLDPNGVGLQSTLKINGSSQPSMARKRG